MCSKRKRNFWVITEIYKVNEVSSVLNSFMVQYSLKVGELKFAVSFGGSAVWSKFPENIFCKLMIACCFKLPAEKLDLMLKGKLQHCFLQDLIL